ncbi:MAG: hypothetical protein F6K16_29655 [Symploca sp. SIO2B6]|nr:hypothetical protein [Symploca sp. SIO2B6]
MMAKRNDSKICYTTLAIGHEYNLHAKKLADDISQLSPNIPIVILTDRPKVFTNHSSVIPIKHDIQSVGIFHDKLCCIEKSLENFECCIFLDADCRLIENMANSRDWKPGLTVKTCWDLSEHIHPKGASERAVRTQKLVHEVAKELSVPINDAKFVYEAIFVVHADSQKEIEFLKTWKQIRDFFESNGIFDGEGVAMGLAAAKASLNVHHYNSGYDGSKDIKDVYKDKIFYRLLLHQDRQDLPNAVCDKVLEFDRQRKQNQKGPIWRKIKRKIILPTMKRIRLAQLKIRHYGKKEFANFL